MNNGLDFRSLTKGRYLCEALDLDEDNRLELLFVPRVGKDVSKVFLRQLADTYPDASYSVVWASCRLSSSGWRRGCARQGALVAPAGLQSRTHSRDALERYRQDGIANRLFTALSDVEPLMLNESEPLRTGAHRARHPVGQYSIVSSANACGRN